MPTLPLFDRPDARGDAAEVSPDASHRVTAPGGYEWWHFDAEDPAGDLWVVCGLYDGFPFHPGYLRAHASYLRRPTRVAPAAPSQYPCASVAVYEQGRVLATFVAQYPPGAFQASAERPQVKVGPNVLDPGEAGTLRLRMEHRGVAAEMLFEPLWPAPPFVAEARRLVPVGSSGPEHFHVIAGPRCQVSGMLRIPGAGGTAGRVIEFRGRGFHDHRYGSGPLMAGVRRWVRGRVLGDDGVTVFSVVEPLDGSRPPVGEVAEIHAGRVRSSPEGGEPVRVTWPTGLLAAAAAARYPTAVNTGHVSLSRPRLLDAGPFAARLTYEAELVTCEPFGQGERRHGTALCEVIEARRLRRPFLGRVAERAIEQVDGVPLG